MAKTFRPSAPPELRIVCSVAAAAALPSVVVVPTALAPPVFTAMFPLPRKNTLRLCPDPRPFFFRKAFCRHFSHFAPSPPSLFPLPFSPPFSYCSICVPGREVSARSRGFCHAGRTFPTASGQPSLSPPPSLRQKTEPTREGAQFLCQRGDARRGIDTQRACLRLCALLPSVSLSCPPNGRVSCAPPVSCPPSLPFLFPMYRSTHPPRPLSSCRAAAAKTPPDQNHLGFVRVICRVSVWGRQDSSIASGLGRVQRTYRKERARCHLSGGRQNRRRLARSVGALRSPLVARRSLLVARYSPLAARCSPRPAPGPAAPVQGEIAGDARAETCNC